MPQSDQADETAPPPSAPSDQPRTAEEPSHGEAVSKPGGFKNDPDDAANPNEAIERHRRKLRP